VIFDAAGNVYGTSEYGGDFTKCPNIGCGAVWEFSPALGGGYTETKVYTFSSGSDGATPYAGLTPDSAGNLYGVAAAGGNLSRCFGQGCGVVFELSPNSSGGWTETVLYAFNGGRDGGSPWAGLTFDAAGNLYGTTAGGGNLSLCSCGVVFELSPTSGGTWTETVLHAFTNGNDGGTPFGTLIFDAAGNLYGTTEGGGNLTCAYNTIGCGVVFELSPVAGHWKETVLHKFNNADGDNPEAGVVFDAAGNLYGTAAVGGEKFGCDAGCGTVFKLSPTTSGPWKFTGLHEFTQEQLQKGFYPLSNLLVDGSGNVYGTASGGGQCDGIVFKLAQNSSGAWIETVIHNFGCATGDGGEPLGTLVSDSAGNLYGATSNGGTNKVGDVFRITP
jgi:uncharacterized repeat protein (TIGR03803 family)